ncbi:MAG: glycosyl transferase family 51, partial [Actinotalea sp.]|nr:glycosyl transferase family 51 [Actinotalea sp.]
PTRASQRAAAASPTTRAGAAAAAGASGRKGLIDYPQQGRTGVRRWLPSWRLVLGTFLTFVALGIGAFAVAYAQTEIPTPADMVKAQTTTVYFADGVTEMGTFSEQNRVLVEESTIPQHVKDAVVAAEDRTFYENPGINPAGIVRALYNNLRGNDRQGGSSITQQYAERFYSDSTITSYSGKLREALLAIKLARAQDKDVILGNYLNTIYFGRDSYGIETAAQSYFGVGVGELTVSQAALIAGIIPSPNNWDPRFDAEKAEDRWNYVLDGMVETGTLTQDERDSQEFPETVEFAPPQTYQGTNGYLLDMVRREILANSSVTDADLDQVGYKIVTTIDPTLQAMAVDAINQLPADHAPNLRTALVSLDPKDGAIVALYGGADYLAQAQNNATQDVAQAGSTFKPFTLVANLEAGNSLESRYLGTNRLPVEGFPEGVRNFDDASFPEIDVVEATARSVNAVYAQMNVEVGPETTLDVARRAGVCESDEEGGDCSALDNQGFPSNVLGTASPHPIDMAQSFNTFAAQGVRHQPFIVRVMEYLDGTGVVYQGAKGPAPVFAADVMADTTYALSQVVDHPRGTGRKAQEVGHPVAGKTGTSNENKSAWFVGYTGSLTTAVTLYQPGPDGTPESITGFGDVEFVTGGSHPLDVWTTYMTGAMAGREVIEFPPPANVGKPNEKPKALVPDVVGLAESEAVAAIEGAGFSVAVARANDESVPEGVVASSSPGGGTELELGSTVTINVSDGKAPASGVPDVIGLTESAARAAIEAAGFVASSGTVSDPAPAGQVIDQNPPGGGQAEPGSTVTFVVSSGPGQPVEPPPPGPTTPPVPTTTPQPSVPPAEPPAGEPPALPIPGTTNGKGNGDGG